MSSVPIPGHRQEPLVEVGRQIGSSPSDASVCLQPSSHEDEALLLASVSKRVLCETRRGIIMRLSMVTKIWAQNVDRVGRNCHAHADAENG
jgi:hypothetical protein